MTEKQNQTLKRGKINGKQGLNYMVQEVKNKLKDVSILRVN